MAKRKSPAKASRDCDVCGKTAPVGGALPYEWDAHLLSIMSTAAGLIEQRMVLSCSAECRAQRGWAERKGACNG